MKTRNGFVSNSSSSSFIVAKTFLTEDQIKAIKDWYNGLDDDVYVGDGSKYLYDEKHYMSAEIYNVWDEFAKVCKDNGIDTKKMFFTEG